LNLDLRAKGVCSARSDITTRTITRSRFQNEASAKIYRKEKKLFDDTRDKCIICAIFSADRIMLSNNTFLQNRYRIKRHLGQGGMGTVYEAVDERLSTTVALKESHFNEEHLCKQFEREAKILARLRHPALARVIDHFTEDDTQFLVMDFISGNDLDAVLKQKGRAFSVNEILDWADQLLDALEYLHNQTPPIIHRDIKPQNLKLTDDGQIVLLDFGLAKGFSEQTNVTAGKSLVGFTLNYASLEQIQGTGTEARSDLYSLAAALYHLLTGIVPSDVLARVSAMTDGQPDPLRPANELNPSIPNEVALILSKAMSLGRSQRYNNAAEMREVLRNANQTTSKANSELETVILPDMKTNLMPLAPTVASSEFSSESLPSETPVLKNEKTAHQMNMTSTNTESKQSSSKTVQVVAAIAVLLFVGFVGISIFGLYISGFIGKSKTQADDINKETQAPSTNPSPLSQREQKLAKAKEILNRARSGEDFASLMKQYSEDPGGDYTFGRGMMVKPFEDAAFALEPGQISNVVESEFGFFHIIKLEERRTVKNQNGETEEEVHVKQIFFKTQQTRE
jgi:serine/threonine protein kinase